MLEITIINHSESRVPKKFIQSWCREFSMKLNLILQKKIKGKELTLVFLDAKPAQKLNREFRGKNYATDVLSFESLEPGALGELVLCPQIIEKQAREHELSYKAELGYMLIHGVLHLLGFEHEGNAREAQKMFRLQDRLFDEMLKLKN